MPPRAEPSCELWRCECGRLWQNSITRGCWIIVPPDVEAAFGQMGVDLP
jgi:hypothetical protein